MTSISACAVGSASSRVRLPALAITAPPRTSAAPIGASPRSFRRPRLGEGEAHRIAALPRIARHESPASRRSRTEAFFGWRRGAFGLRTGGRRWQRGARRAAERSEHERRNEGGNLSGPRGPADRQGHGARRHLFPPRRRSLDRRGAGRASTARCSRAPPSTSATPTTCASTGSGSARLERTRLFLFHKPRGFVTTARDPEGRRDRVRRAAAGPAAPGRDRPAGHQHRRAPAAHQRRRAGAGAGAAVDRLAAPLSGARAREHRSGGARPA